MASAAIAMPTMRPTPGVGIDRHRQIRRGERDDQPERGDDDRQCEGAAAESDDDGFDQELAHEPRARRAERGAHGGLQLPGRAPSDHHGGDVGAGREQPEHGRDQQDLEARRHVLVVQHLARAETIDARAPSSLARRLRRRHLR